jgi:hypothetical protein
MKYKVQFSRGWAGTWIFEATHDVQAWERAGTMIKEHKQADLVDIDSIYELDASDVPIRRIPEYADCDKTVIKKERKKTEKRERTRMYRAYFNDGQCSGPYIAKSDEMALEVGKFHAKFHAEYIKISANEIKIIEIDEIEMFKSEKGSKWYIKIPLTMLRPVNLQKLKADVSAVKNNELNFGN